MAITNHERVNRAMDLLRRGLGPFIEREIQNIHKEKTLVEAHKFMGEDRLLAGKKIPEWDAAALLKLMWEAWHAVFRKTLGHAERSLISELRDIRNKWAHQSAFSGDDAYRALDSVARLLIAVSAPEAEEVEKMKMDLLRLRFDEQVRSEKRKQAGTAIVTEAAATLPPWREVVTPHEDVAKGRYQQAEFAADLWQVHIGEGTAEYKNPVEFFQRTFLTESLKRLLVNAIRRLSGTDGDPVVQLQTNFGGGKTHSMLALYHLFSGSKTEQLAGVAELMAEAGAETLVKAKLVVLVGNRISPGNPVTKEDGTVVRTLWGELAWQLGGKKAFSTVAADDEKATSPGDRIRELLNEYGPCVILIDEWVAYARQLHDQGDLPAGSFETQFTFAQALTESVKLAKNCMIVISLPASDSVGSPHTHADDAEVGGIRGREALDRLRNVIGRLESSWRPASAEESFEIVRRRLFEPLIDPDKYKQRDMVARAFADLYRDQHQEFPPECRESDYEERIKAAYPIHPEIFERLYCDWSTLAKFQRTRGVLRLMAAVIHSLWVKGDRNPLIMPSLIPIDDQRVQFELTRNLSDNWIPVIERDIDGTGSLPLQLEGEITNLGKYAAFRRVARTIYLGSAPTQTAAHRGLEDRQIKLGCVMPGESPAIFGDALRRLAAAATYLYQDGPRYWYSTQPTVNKLAEDRADQIRRDQDKINQEIERRLRVDLRKTGNFSRVHPLPRDGVDVPDDTDARLVVLTIDTPYSKERDNPAVKAAQAILESRGTSPRLYRNTLVFLAADGVRLQDLEEAVGRYLAWESIIDDKETLNLDPHQVKQAEQQKRTADVTVSSRIPETYQWLIVPSQASAQREVEWEAIRLSGQDTLAERASKRLIRDEQLRTSFGGTMLSREIDRIPLWRGDHVEIRQLMEDFARYLYLPRLADSGILVRSVIDGVETLTWLQDTFAYAESYDQEAGRYRGLRAGRSMLLSAADASGLLVKSDIASRQLEAELKPTGGGEFIGPEPPGPEPPEPPDQPIIEKKIRRFHGSVALGPTRVGRDAGRVAEEVIAHLVGLAGSKVNVSLEIEAEVKDGVPENVVRIVTENSRTLKFTSHGFEEE